jgi:hypothetical protein
VDCNHEHTYSTFFGLFFFCEKCVPPDNVQTQSPRVCVQVLRDGGGAAAAQLNAYASLDWVPPLLYRLVLAGSQNTSRRIIFRH